MYLAHFGLRERPFHPTPDPRFFYANAAYLEAEAGVLYAIRERKGFAVLTGEVGTGKTTLLHRLMTSGEPDVRFVFLYTTRLPFADILRATCTELGLVARADTLENMQALNDYLIAELARQGTVALLVDEAQNLTEEALEGLRLLSNLETATEKLLQIVLSGQPELDATLARPSVRQLRQRIAVHRRLEPLGPDEVTAYVEARLRLAGHDGRRLFTSRALRVLAECSGGNPRVINFLGDAALVIAYGAGRATVTDSIVLEAARDLRIEPPSRRHARAPGSDRAERTGHRRLAFGVVAAGVVGATMLATTWLARSGDVQGALRVSVARVATASANVQGAVLDSLARVASALAPASTVAPAIAPPAGAALPDIGTPAPTGMPSASPSLPEESSPAAASTPEPPAPHALPAVKEAERPPALPPREGTRRLTPAAGESTRRSEVVVQRGGTIGAVARDAYGPRQLLGMDLLQETNAVLTNVNRVDVGQRLRVPALGAATLVRETSAGPLQLVVDAVRDPRRAAALAATLRDAGYEASIHARHLAPDIVIYRITIEGLPDRAAAARAWDAIQAEQRPVNPDGRVAGETAPAR